MRKTRKIKIDGGKCPAGDEERSVDSIRGQQPLFPLSILHYTPLAILFFAFLFPFFTLNAQQVRPTNIGNDFWVAYLENGGDQRPRTLQVTAVGDTTCTVTVTNPLTNWTTSNTLNGGSYVSIQLPDDAVPTASAATASRAYHITSTAGITLLSCYTQVASSGTTLVLPSTSLRSRYIVMDYPTDPGRLNISGAALAFVAIEDGTTLSMCLPCTVEGAALQVGDTLTVTLNAGQSYMIRNNTANGTFSGMEVSGNKPFAMFEGNQITGVPYTTPSGDYMYEQAIPMDMWGTEFALISTLDRTTGDIYRVVASDSCTITLSNGTSYSLAPHGCQVIDLASGTNLRLSSTRPVCVGLCMKGSDYYAEFGDANMVLLPSLDRGVNHGAFQCYPTSRISQFYVNVVARNVDIANVRLDNNTLSFQTLDAQYSYARQQIYGNTHFLTCTTGDFVAWTYGLGRVDSYANVVGWALDAPPQDTVDIYDTICQGQEYDSLGLSLQPAQTQTAGELHYERDYQGVHYVFHLTVMPVSRSDVYDSIAPGDTMTWNGIEVTAAGEYTVTLTDANGCDSVVTLHLFYIGSTVDLYDTLCAGNAYSGHGFSVSIVTADTVMARDTVEDDVPKHYVLHLTALPNVHTDINLSIINGDTVAVCDTLLSVAGDYTFHYTSANGCDSTVVVHLAYETVGIHASKEGVCPGEEVTLSATGTHTYVWSASPYDPELDAQQGINPIVVHPMQTTVYSLLDAAGNVLATVSVGTEAAPSLCVEVNRDILDFDNPVLLFTDCSDGRYSTSWHFADGRHFTGEKIRRRYYYPLPDSAKVTMTSCNRYNCCADTTIAIPMKILSVWFPNVFTPGEDNNNLFQCFTSFDVEMFELVIYNRWGLLMWRSEDVNEGWDGRRTDGTPCPQGAYAYKYYLKSTDGTVRHGSGTVTIIR